LSYKRIILTLAHQTFNEELDAMFADNSLREDQALVAMADDLRKTKGARNDAIRENACVSTSFSLYRI